MAIFLRFIKQLVLCAGHHLNGHPHRLLLRPSLCMCSSFRAGFLSLNKNLCAQDQATCMTKMLVCGMPLDEVIKASTSTPAAAIGYGDKIGTLRVGAEADIALLEMRRTDFMLEDSQAQTRRCTQRLIARGVWRAGVAGKITSPEQVGAFPNLRNVALHRPSWNILVVRDIVAPPEVSPEFRAMVEQRLAEMEEKAEEWMKSSPVGDGNPNTPLWLTVSAAHSNPTRVSPPLFAGLLGAVGSGQQPSQRSASRLDSRAGSCRGARMGTTQIGRSGR